MTKYFYSYINNNEQKTLLNAYILHILFITIKKQNIDIFLLLITS